MHETPAKHHLDGVWINQTAKRDAASADARRVTPQQSAELLTDAEGAALYNVGLRKWHDITKEPWFPTPVMLGPRCKRHIKSELLAAMTNRAPRRDVLIEPAQLVQARARRKGAA